MTAKQSSSSEAQQKTIEDIIEKRSDQPISIPDEVRAAVEKELGGEKIRLYAFAGSAKKAKQQWLAISDHVIAIARVKRAGRHSTRSISRAPTRRGDVHLTFGLSGSGAPFALLAGGSGAGAGLTGAGTGFYFGSAARAEEYERIERVVVTSDFHPVKVTVEVVRRQAVTHVSTKSGRNKAVLTLRDCRGRRLAAFRYGRPQRYAVGKIRFALERPYQEQRFEPAAEADAVYRTCVRQAIREEREPFSVRELIRRVFSSAGRSPADHTKVNTRNSVTPAPSTTGR